MTLKNCWKVTRPFAAPLFPGPRDTTHRRGGPDRPGHPSGQQSWHPLKTGTYPETVGPAPQGPCGWLRAGRPRRYQSGRVGPPSQGQKYREAQETMLRVTCALQGAQSECGWLLSCPSGQTQEPLCVNRVRTGSCCSRHTQALYSLVCTSKTGWLPVPQRRASLTNREGEEPFPDVSSGLSDSSWEDFDCVLGHVLFYTRECALAGCSWHLLQIQIDVSVGTGNLISRM